MTDKTQPEALRLANEFKLCNEYDSIPSMNDIAKAEAELRRQHARIAELEAQLEAIGAGAGSGPMMARAADHFPGVTTMAARWYMVDKDGMATLCTDREDAEQEAKDANMAWPHTAPHRAVQLLEVGASAAELHPSPPGGMVGGWMPIETAPKDSGYLLLRGGREQDVASGYWLQAAYAGNGAWIWPFVHMTPRFWAPLPPTTSAGSKGE